MDKARGFGFLVLTGATFSASGVALAHTPYLLPNAFDVVERKHVTVEASFTETFFVPDVAMKADDYHVLAPDGAKLALAPIYAQDLAVLEVPIAGPGTYRISTGQRNGRMAKAALVGGEWKFLEPGATPPAGAHLYDVKSITTADVFVTRGAPTNAALAPRNVGLEFRPITHPNGLFVGSSAQFEVLFDGRVLAHQPITVHFGDERYANRKVYEEMLTDAAGRFSVRLTKPGIYLATSRHRVLPAAVGALAVSHTYSVTFEATD